MRRLLAVTILALFFAPFGSAAPVVGAPAREQAERYEAAARDLERAAAIWEGLGERAESARRWEGSADNWERAARAWELVPEPARARAAWESFRAALTARSRLRIHLASPDTQITLAVAAPPSAARVLVTDDSGAPVPNARIRFEWGGFPEGSTPKLLTPEAVSDSFGVAIARFQPGTKAGVHLLLVRTPGQTGEPLTIRIDAAPAAPHRLEAIGQTEQVLRVNQTAAYPFEVRVTDVHGNPVPGTPISFRLVAAPQGAIGQEITPEEASTDARGIASVRVRAGQIGGEYLLKAESGELVGSPLRLKVLARQTIPTVRIQAVRIEGTEAEVFLAAASEIRTGSHYLLPELGRVIAREMDRLYATGRFEDVAAYLDRKGEDIAEVVFRVRPRLRVGTVTIEGTKKVTEAQIRSTITLAQGGYYDPASVPRATIAVQELYRNEGYLGAKIEVDTHAVDSGTVSVAFRIREGSLTKISRLVFLGNRALSNWGLNWHMKTGSGRVFKREEFREDKRKIQEIYGERGYLSAQMGEPEFTFDDKGRMVATIRIVEGPQYKMGEVRFIGQEIIPDALLAETLRPPRGKVFRARKFFASLNKVRQAFTSRGYAEATLDPDENLDEDRGIANWTVRVRLGQILVLDTVIVVGNEVTKTEVITRELLVRPGQIINGERLDRSREKLENLQFFEPGSVRFELRRISSDPSDTRRLLAVNVKEGRTGEFQFGAGYSSADGLVGFLSLTKRNFDPFHPWSFTGAGQELSLSGNWGSQKTSYSISFTEPWFRGRPLAVGFDIFNIAQERTGYDWLRRGGALRLGWRPTDVDRVDLSYNYRRTRADDIQINAPQEILAEADYPNRYAFDRTTTSILARYGRDKRDNVRFPREGYRLTVSNEAALPYLGGNVGFDKPTFEFSNYLPGGFRNVFAWRFNYSTMISAFTENRRIPEFEKYFSGGVDSVRGYPERDLQVYDASGRAVGNGQTSTFLNLEYRIPFDEEDQFSMVLFYDMGGVFPDAFDLQPEKIARGAGAGFRFASPVGPIRVEWGRGFDFPNKNKDEIHFTIGYPF